MAQIYNTDLFKEVKDVAKLQQNTDVIPTRLGDTIVPVVNVNPKDYYTLDIYRDGSHTAYDSGTILYTTPTDKDFYLTNVVLTASANVAFDGSQFFVDFVDANNVARGVRMAHILTNISGGQVSVQFYHPILIKRGTDLKVGMSVGTAGAANVRGAIAGYLVYNTKA